MLKHLLQVLQAILDPLDGRRPKDLLPAATERVDLVNDRLDASLGLNQGFRERLTPATFADKVDEVCEAPLFGR